MISMNQPSQPGKSPQDKLTAVIEKARERHRAIREGRVAELAARFEVEKDIWPEIFGAPYPSDCTGWNDLERMVTNCPPDGAVEPPLAAEKFSKLVARRLERWKRGQQRLTARIHQLIAIFGAEEEDWRSRYGLDFPSDFESWIKLLDAAGITPEKLRSISCDIRDLEAAVRGLLRIKCSGQNVKPSAAKTAAESEVPLPIEPVLSEIEFNDCVVRRVRELSRSTAQSADLRAKPLLCKLFAVLFREGKRGRALTADDIRESPEFRDNPPKDGSIRANINRLNNELGKINVAIRPSPYKLIKC
jgi:hypothetical protein